VYNPPFNFFENTVPLNSSGIDDSTNLFQRILTFLCEFREYAKSFYRFGDTPKVFNHMWSMREKLLSVHRDYVDFRVAFMYTVVSEYAKRI
jgi:hypothetical protein